MHHRSPIIPNPLLGARSPGDVNAAIRRLARLLGDELGHISGATTVGTVSKLYRVDAASSFTITLEVDPTNPFAEVQFMLTTAGGTVSISNGTDVIATMSVLGDEVALICDDGTWRVASPAGDEGGGGGIASIRAGTVQELKALGTDNGIFVGQGAILTPTGSTWIAATAGASTSTWRPGNVHVSPRDYGVSSAETGANNLTYFQALIDDMTALGGATIVCDEDFDTTGRLIVKPFVQIDLNGHTVSPTLTGDVNAFRIMSNASLRNGTIAVSASAGTGGHGARHIPIEAGNFFTPEDVYGWSIEDIEIDDTNLWSGSNGMIIGGMVHGGFVRNITCTSQGNIARLVLFHFSEPSANQVSYPYEVSVHSIHCDDLASTDGAEAIVACSGGFNIRVDGISGSSSRRLFRYYAGDSGPAGMVSGMEWQAKLVGTGIHVKNADGVDCYDGFTVDGRCGTDTSETVPASVLFENCHARGAGTSGNGWVLDDCRGVRIIGCSASEFTNSGVVTVANVVNLTIDGEFFANALNGIRLRDTSGTSRGIKVKGHIYGNGTNTGAANGSRAGVHISSNVFDVDLTEAILGEDSEATQTYGLRVDDNTPRRIKAHSVYVAGATLVGLSVGSSTDWDIDFDVEKCAAAGGVTLLGGASPRKLRGNGFYEAWASAAPTAGTWTRGSVVWNTAPAAAGAPGWVCVTAGTPGTWKAMANVAA